MYKYRKTYTNFDGVEVTEDFYFNLTEAELSKIEFGQYGGFSATLQKILDSKNMVEAMKVFEEIIHKSYGVKTPDGRFYKSEEEYKIFESTQAYSDIYMELASDENKMIDFINKIIPAKVMAKAEEVRKKNGNKPLNIEEVQKLVDN